MALVISDEATREAERILACSNSFEVLELSPSNCTKEMVLEQYEAKVSLFKGLFRNKLAMQAKAKLGNAKVRLADAQLREKEAAALKVLQSDAHKNYAELQALEVRTRVLEMRAATVQGEAA
ncbi:hypothetical protein conserved [Leishmania donovani]|uniref:Uncharacterized protein n=3 Tax=Leishmania donovani species complex TaxID=38574 RepID=A4ID35_LEIIN|nr:conserved hypothetical protein [Leishmania infantum JPCM5]TPP42077.1 hypothetical protein CGC20_28095 [Leishmania donovani]CAC9551341.1 hypothetical_protein_-_conserved [Leishmania infantum]CAJ1993753.1 hypothetical protein conserved [Leishmania donovani]CAM72764.1 conserved hypothetical protein [Leishmania infantum JPCM5]SUZ46759.1 hypothetical_protein_-_conserved [Leishmania infantum]|eukprot:XP_001469654.1 conserved hypothetical protein [Leishmania infantum JPCM5]